MSIGSGSSLEVTTGHCLPASGADPASFAARIHAVVGPLIPNGAPLALFDFPNQPNVGDSAIWLGEMKYLATFQPDSRLVWVSDIAVAGMTRPKLPADAVVLIHGGGNLGDVWPRHQAHREAVIERYSGHRIIQLPQSIHFSNPANFERFGKVVGGHPDLHLLVRDDVSREALRRVDVASVQLCPDMALCLTLPLPRMPAHEVVALLRTDHETTLSSPTGDGMQVFVTDWLEEPRSINRTLDRISTWYPNRLVALRPYIYQRLARERVARGCALLASGKVVITDRLHAHILCTLLGIPHVALDNSYRKIANFMQTWHTGEGLVHTATTVADAIELAYAIVQRTDARRSRVWRRPLRLLRRGVRS
jgi:pyruvyl transferase EpsO